MADDDIDSIKEHRICSDCVGEQFLGDEIQNQGSRAKCSYCGRDGQTYSIEDMSERIETAFDEHYVRTSDTPDAYQSMMLSDKESDYDWEREGQQTVYAIMDAAEIPEEAASDIQQILNDKYSDFDSQAMGEETEYDDDAYYEPKGADDGRWQAEWRDFERSLRTEARFFSQSAAKHLASVFEGIDTLRTRKGRSLITSAGPGTTLPALYRARVFQSGDKLTAALERPDKQLGSPPSANAAAGRMNARGISVFYGANDPNVAIAEVRPPVGSRVAVARFEIIRPLRLLNLTALGDVTITGSIFDPTYRDRLGRAMFLRSLSRRIVRPVMPDDEPFDYLATQAVADFLATENDPRLDGIIYPSVQAKGKSLNVVLFHKAAEVQELDIPPGTEISARSGMWGEDGWEDDYSVSERVPKAKATPTDPVPHPFAHIADYPDIGTHDDTWLLFHPTLRIDTDSIDVHHVEAVEVKTQPWKVRRHRWESRDQDF